MDWVLVLEDGGRLDGRADGVVGNLTACSFDPAALRCTGLRTIKCPCCLSTASRNKHHPRG